MTICSDYDAIVVGAGFSGMATTAALRRYGVDNVLLLEAGGRFGAFWSKTYDRISLHSPWHGLPDDGGLNEGYPIFKSRQQLLDYFDRYAERHLLKQVTRFGEALVAAHHEPGDDTHPWRVETPRGSYRARHLVIATGYCRRPRVPSFSGLYDFEVPWLHSRDFRNGSPDRNCHMLVVGSGNSAFEIATDLVEHGAASVTVLVHGPRHVIPIESFAEAMEAARADGAYSVDTITHAHPWLPQSTEYAECVSAFDGLLGSLAQDLSIFGLETPSEGAWTLALRDGRVPVFDHGAVPLIKAGEIRLLNDRIASFSGDTVKFSRSAALRVDGVIFATGFEPGLDGFLEDARLLVANPNRGAPYPATDQRCRSTVLPGLFFVGYDMSAWGGMAHGHWGFEVAEKIAISLGTFSEDLRPREFLKAPWLG